MYELSQIITESHYNQNKSKQLSKKIKSCTLCPDLVKSRSQPVSGYGDFLANIFIVGEAPGRFGADITGVPFTKDRSGVFLQKILCGLGVNKSDPKSEKPKLDGVYITNIVKCNPRKEDGTNRSPKSDEISNCNNYLEKELCIIKPKLVITLGLPASQIIFQKSFDVDNFTGKNFGKLHKGKDFYILPLWHPAFIVRGGGAQRMNEEKYVKFFNMAKKFI